MKNAVIMFVKEPLLGCVKTRLAKDTSEKFALQLYINMVEDLFQTLQDFELILYAYPTINFYNNSNVYEQKGTTLGDKMYNAFYEQFKKGYDNLVLIGSDTPQLSADYIRDSFQHLESKNIIIGPSDDGGYYLIGLRKKALKKELFEEISWSTNRVLHQTLQKINKEELYLLRYLNDIDTLTDLTVFYNRYKKSMAASNTIEFLNKVSYENL